MLEYFILQSDVTDLILVVEVNEKTKRKYPGLIGLGNEMTAGEGGTQSSDMS